MIPEKFTDKITYAFRTGIDSLFLRHPLRTATGFLIGSVVYVVADLFRPFFEQIKVLNLEGLSFWYCLVIGLFIAHAMTIFSILFNRPKFDENTETAFKLIAEAKKNGVSEIMIRQLYLNLCEKAVEKANFDEKTRKKMKQIQQLISDNPE